MPVHCVAHLAPTLSTGTVETGYSKHAVSTLDLTHMIRTDATCKWWWDRGASATLLEVNAAVIVAHNLNSRGGTLEIFAGAGSNPTSSIGSITPSATEDQNVMFTITGSTARYLAATVTHSSSPLFFGCVSIGRYFDLGNNLHGLQRGMGITPTGNPARTVTATFAAVPMADAVSIAYYMGSGTAWRMMYSGHTREGLSGGRHPIALADTDGVVYWGPGQVSITEDRPSYATVVVTVTDADGVFPQV